MALEEMMKDGSLSRLTQRLAGAYGKESRDVFYLVFSCALARRDRKRLVMTARSNVAQLTASTNRAVTPAGHPGYQFNIAFAQLDQLGGPCESCRGSGLRRKSRARRGSK